ncbi:hypothetical protein [Brevundimonas sp.]|uniref:hypothetical protein n=1 Tax=Brevundimonas sp. TaxID=1871086 RepID=UPI0035B16E5F
MTTVAPAAIAAEGGPGMCNEYQLILPFDDVIEAFNRNGDRLVFPGGMPNFGPMASIRIGDRAPIITLGAEGAQMMVAPWAWKSPQGRPVFNFRSDGRSFDGAVRCLIPADGFFEFTDPEPRPEAQDEMAVHRRRCAGVLGGGAGSRRRLRHAHDGARSRHRAVP